MRKGLILEGGAMRGLFSAGVMDVMMENGIDFDGAIGVSAGAAFGCNYKSKQIGRTIRYNIRFADEWRYCSWRSWLLTGDLYGADFCYKELPAHLDVFDFQTFRKNPMEFYVVCTDAHTAKPVYHKLVKGTEQDLDWIRASASMPVVSHPVHIDGYDLLDGGISDSVPVHYFESIGYRKNVIILTQPAAYVKEPQDHQKLLKHALHNYPEVFKKLEHRHVAYNQTMAYIRQLEQTGQAFVVRPPRPLQIGSIEHDPEEMKRVYKIGKAEGKRQVEKMKQFLSE
ncbi:MAG: patatin-like phospholipase family protein [Catenisphaera adipataccumulans]|jgi:predicted patatin/cPLA2 family phospholipase|uniref:patatin-like phospholipase family protein n=1 Tax=Catenisphaera adipataccumulans TaxID=700500 RepID=UPI003D8D4C49